MGQNLDLSTVFGLARCLGSGSDCSLFPLSFPLTIALISLACFQSLVSVPYHFDSGIALNWQILEVGRGMAVSEDHHYPAAPYLHYPP